MTWAHEGDPGCVRVSLAVDARTLTEMGILATIRYHATFLSRSRGPNVLLNFQAGLFAIFRAVLFRVSHCFSWERRSAWDHPGVPSNTCARSRMNPDAIHDRSLSYSGWLNGSHWRVTTATS